MVAVLSLLLPAFTIDSPLPTLLNCHGISSVQPTYIVCIHVLVISVSLKMDIPVYTQLRMRFVKNDKISTHSCVFAC